ncbi:hypothetical protein D3C76_1623570 [compost metagenome]
MSVAGLGSTLTIVLNEILTETPGAIVPSEMPFAGLVLGCGIPSTSTLPATNEEPAGIGSLMFTLLILAIPLLVTVRL